MDSLPAGLLRVLQSHSSALEQEYQNDSTDQSAQSLTSDYETLFIRMNAWWPELPLGLKFSLSKEEVEMLPLDFLNEPWTSIAVKLSNLTGELIALCDLEERAAKLQEKIQVKIGTYSTTAQDISHNHHEDSSSQHGKPRQTRLLQLIQREQSEPSAPFAFMAVETLNLQAPKISDRMPSQLNYEMDDLGNSIYTVTTPLPKLTTADDFNFSKDLARFKMVMRWMVFYKYAPGNTAELAPMRAELKRQLGFSSPFHSKLACFLNSQFRKLKNTGLVSQKYGEPPVYHKKAERWLSGSWDGRIESDGKAGEAAPLTNWRRISTEVGQDYMARGMKRAVTDEQRRGRKRRLVKSPTTNVDTAITSISEGYLESSVMLRDHSDIEPHMEPSTLTSEALAADFNSNEGFASLIATPITPAVVATANEIEALASPEVDGMSCLSVDGAVLEPDPGVTASASSAQQCVRTSPADNNSASDLLHTSPVRSDQAWSNPAIVTPQSEGPAANRDQVTEIDVSGVLPRLVAAADGPPSHILPFPEVVSISKPSANLTIPQQDDAYDEAACRKIAAYYTSFERLFELEDIKNMWTLLASMIMGGWMVVLPPEEIPEFSA